MTWPIGVVLLKSSILKLPIHLLSKRFHENVAFYTKQDFLTISLACLTISLSLFNN